MTEPEAFRESMRENPDDDTVRLVFADWLDEHGEHRKAELLRLAVEARSRPGPAQLERLRVLRVQVGTDWIGQVLSSRFDPLFTRVAEAERLAEEQQEQEEAWREAEAREARRAAEEREVEEWRRQLPPLERLLFRLGPTAELMVLVVAGVVVCLVAVGTAAWVIQHCATALKVISVLLLVLAGVVGIATVLWRDGEFRKWWKDWL